MISLVSTSKDNSLLISDARKISVYNIDKQAISNSILFDETAPITKTELDPHHNNLVD